MDFRGILKFQGTSEMLLLEDPNIPVVSEFCLRNWFHERGQLSSVTELSLPG